MMNDDVNDYYVFDIEKSLFETRARPPSSIRESINQSINIFFKSGVCRECASIVIFLSFHARRNPATIRFRVLLNDVFISLPFITLSSSLWRLKMGFFRLLPFFRSITVVSLDPPNYLPDDIHCLNTYSTNPIVNITCQKQQL